jgi:hypothetical protein
MMAVAKMAAAEDSGSGRGQEQRRRTMMAKDDGTQDWVADFDGKGQEWAANNDCIRHRPKKLMLF